MADEIKFEMVCHTLEMICIKKKVLLKMHSNEAILCFL